MLNTLLVLIEHLYFSQDLLASNAAYDECLREMAVVSAQLINARDAAVFIWDKPSNELVKMASCTDGRQVLPPVGEVHTLRVRLGNHRHVRAG